MSVDHIPCGIWDPVTKTILRKFPSGWQDEPDILTSLSQIASTASVLFPLATLAFAVIASQNFMAIQTIGEWAQLNPGPKPIPLYFLYKDGRLLDEARVAEQCASGGAVGEVAGVLGAAHLV